MSAERAPAGGNPLLRLAELGQSIWYDYITRDLLTSGELERLIREDGLRGMTSNPTIFEKAIAGSHLYDDDIRRLSECGCGAGEILEALAVADVQAACDAFLPLHQQSVGATASSPSRCLPGWRTMPTPRCMRPTVSGPGSDGRTQ